jgi:hypothetical protein
MIPDTRCGEKGSSLIIRKDIPRDLKVAAGLQVTAAPQLKKSMSAAISHRNYPQAVELCNAGHQ